MQSTSQASSAAAHAGVSAATRVGSVLLIPGALFEIGIAFWLIFKGFDRAAMAKGTEPTADGAGPRDPAAVPVAA